MTILVTGGAGFIGSNFILSMLSRFEEKIINLDKLTYAGNLKNLSSISNNKNYIFAHGDIADIQFVTHILNQYQPRAIINFAAETHVDRSIHGPAEFIQTNIVGTHNLLECTRLYWVNLRPDQQSPFRFLHISTDEVYGSLEPNDPPFNENNPYKPNSPYSASKASADHLVRAYHHTYSLPVLTTNCSNNYGPFQFIEKLIPLVIHRALKGETLPIYGDGKNIRDWLYVDDHCSGIKAVLEHGRVGETYNIGGSSEMTNIDVVGMICNILDEKKPRKDNQSYSSQITFVKDRLGHDRRYAIDSSKIRRECGWKENETFNSGIEKTISWYLSNLEWVESLVNGSYRDWINKQYA